MVRVLHPPLRRHSGEIWHQESKAVRGYGLHMGNAPRSFSVSERTYGTPKIHWLIFRWNNCNMTYNTVAPAIFRSHPPNGSARAGSCRVPAWEMPSRPCWQPPPPPEGWNGPWAKPWPLEFFPRCRKKQSYMNVMLEGAPIRANAKIIQDPSLTIKIRKWRLAGFGGWVDPTGANEWCAVSATPERGVSRLQKAFTHSIKHGGRPCL